MKEMDDEEYEAAVSFDSYAYTSCYLTKASCRNENFLMVLFFRDKSDVKYRDTVLLPVLIMTPPSTSLIGSVVINPRSAHMRRRVTVVVLCVYVCVCVCLLPG